MLRIAAASDLQPVLPPLLAEFEGQTGIHAEASYQSSATLATQIINGAPFDLFLAADLSFPQRVIAAGLASWSGGENEDRQLIVRGHANLLEDLHALEDLERIRLLFDDLETKRGVVYLLGRAESAEGVRIFIGSENKLFSLSGSSTIVAPYSAGAGRIVGVLGVIGPTRLNYARVIPMVDYAARIVSRMLGG